MVQRPERWVVVCPIRITSAHSKLRRWINVKLEEINAEPDPDAILLGRRQPTGRMVKKLVEEAIPIACLGLHFCRPLTQVHIKCLAGSQPYDAELQVSGYRSLNLKIEVTTIETDDSALRRLGASQKGFVFSSGPI